REVELAIKCQMGTHGKLLRRILEGRSDANIDFSDLRALLLHLGFEERTRGSHHIFRRPMSRSESTSKGKGTRPSLIRSAKSALLPYATG
ncbi:MAG: type II toxin-antitoxin system HicA family toxin, partial [Gammaproteobacteria bacterium]